MKKFLQKYFNRSNNFSQEIAAKDERIQTLIKQLEIKAEFMKVNIT
jgi:hypothetical protein